MERDKDYDIQLIMHEQLSKLKKAALTYNRWKLVMEDGDVKNKCHQTFIFNIHKKSKYLYHAIHFALKEKGGSCQTWR